MPANNNKDPIEQLFRNKAEEYDISYQETDWLKLEQRLDEQQHLLAIRRRQWMIAAAVVLLFSLLSYAVYQSYQEINQLSEQLENQKIVETPRDDTTGNITGMDEDAPAKDRSDQPSDTPDNSPVEEETPSLASENDKTNNISQEDQPASQTFLVSNTMAQQLAIDELPRSQSSLSSFAADEPEQANLKRSWLNDPYPRSLAAQEEFTDALSVSKNTPYQRSIAASRVSVGFLAGPDLSTVGGFSNFDQPGYNLGLLIEYRLSSNFSIRSGLMRTSVNYQAAGDEYHPPSGFWSYGNAPTQTAAQCLILDIPVSLKYDFLHFERSKLYATAGVNSYIMLNEEYQFDYENYSHQHVEGWSDRTGTRHWLSNASLSIGYAYDLNPHLSMQIEPFLKLPMQEVGWGNVKLYSVGTSISFNYNLY